MLEPGLSEAKNCIEESTLDIFGTFRCPRSHSAPTTVIRHPYSHLTRGELCSPFPPRHAPASTEKRSVGFDYYLVARRASTNHGIIQL